MPGAHTAMLRIRQLLGLTAQTDAWRYDDQFGNFDQIFLPP